MGAINKYSRIDYNKYGPFDQSSAVSCKLREDGTTEVYVSTQHEGGMGGYESKIHAVGTPDNFSGSGSLDITDKFFTDGSVNPHPHPRPDHFYAWAFDSASDVDDTSYRHIFVRKARAALEKCKDAPSV